MVSSAAKPIPEATPNSSPAPGDLKRRPTSSHSGSASLTLSSITPTASIGRVPRSRSVWYSRNPAAATPTDPPAQKQTASVGRIAGSTASRSNR